MASRARALPHNAPGDLFVDASCIDCDACRWIAPATFTRRDEQASVRSQPATPGERRRALMALVACPTGSIGSASRAGIDAAVQAFPDPVADGVHHCGFHHPGTFGAASWLVVREGGNVLVDSPRFTRPLVRRLEELGGVRTMFLTHGDDVGDHARFRDHFGCERVLHRGDLDAGTRGVERVLEGGEPIALAPDLVAIPVPGHTRGSACLLAGGRFLFTGDHAAWSERLGEVYAFRSACWFDWETQIRSMRRLVEHRFEWILPGHGRSCRFPPGEMRRRIAAAAGWMESVA